MFFRVPQTLPLVEESWKRELFHLSDAVPRSNSMGKFFFNKSIRSPRQLYQVNTFLISEFEASSLRFSRFLSFKNDGINLVPSDAELGGSKI
jgi:hypothetical protein